MEQQSSSRGQQSNSSSAPIIIKRDGSNIDAYTDDIVSHPEKYNEVLAPYVNKTLRMIRMEERVKERKEFEMTSAAIKSYARTNKQRRQAQQVLDEYWNDRMAADEELIKSEEEARKTMGGLDLSLAFREAFAKHLRESQTKYNAALAAAQVKLRKGLDETRIAYPRHE